MSIGAVQAARGWLEASVARSELLLADAALAEPELALGWVAAEHDVGKGLNLLAQSGVGAFSQPGGPVPASTGNSDKDVLPCPGVLADDVPQLGEADLELGGTLAEGGTLILEVGFRSCAEAD